jgi:putative redox protein
VSNEAAATANSTARSITVEETGQGKFQVVASIDSSRILIDEPAAIGGLGSGPNPYDLLAAGLGSCTVMTVRLYANRKGWPLSRVRVRVTHDRPALSARDAFFREVLLDGPLDDAQRARLMEIADRCPVHLTLHGGSDITTRMVNGEIAPTEPAACNSAHLNDMEEACRN